MSDLSNKGVSAGDRQMAREEFLSAPGSDALPVRPAVLHSWRRSQALHIHVDRVELPFVREPDLDTPLMNAAQPVLRSIAEDMSSQPVSVILTSAEGLILERFSSDAGINRALDDVKLARGYSYAEQFVGTNGIGTAIETRQPTYILGSEHYVGELGKLACAGVPIHHPGSGTLLGVLDMTCRAEHANPLLLSLAKSASRQIESQLLSQANERETALLTTYLATARRYSRGVLAVAGEMVLMNAHLRRTLDARDQIALLEHALDMQSISHTRTLVAQLPSGRSARVSVADRNEIRSGAVNIVFHVAVEDFPDASGPLTPARVEGDPLPAGLVGNSASLRRSYNQVRRCYADRHWVLMEGESGSGRSTLVKSAARKLAPATHLLVLTPRDFGDPERFLDLLSQELDSSDAFNVLLSDIDRLPEQLVDPVALLLQSVEGTGWVAATTNAQTQRPEVDATLLPFFSHTVTVQALRHRTEDLHELIPHLIDQIHPGSTAQLTPAAVRALSKHPWAGNVTQLRRILVETLNTRRGGVIDVDHLPAECRTSVRRTLSQIESLERDAIVRSLLDNNGNKADAAAALGFSRATIYRKIKEFGIH
ncbi:GAF domain-containing protein [Williamsia sp. 1135]|uniref:sigma-54-dependent Fis family transcriptional regulator n=1 Tax=Williamsia sp. 1135 TaxID=1889262 RepID=UPI000A100C47|nr:GAF domain-containing protein [Williamsia sp. 1135]ORM27013.1 siderophore-interacting protein [Williamsia sp. 1135]